MVRRRIPFQFAILSVIFSPVCDKRYAKLQFVLFRRNTYATVYDVRKESAKGVVNLCDSLRAGYIFCLRFVQQAA